MNETDLMHLFEAALLAAGRPVTTQQLIELFDERERPQPEQVLAALELLRQDFAGRALELVEVSSGWRVQVRSQFSEYVSRLWQERPSRYSRALLETLALIAYRQPITRGEIEEIRGVAVSSTLMRTLHDRNWIRVIGHREVPGRPEILATTKDFLDYFGLKSLEDLPPLAELKDLETVGVQLEFNTGDPSPGDKDKQGHQVSLEEAIAAAVATESSEGEADADEAVEPAETVATSDEAEEEAEVEEEEEAESEDTDSSTSAMEEDDDATAEDETTEDTREAAQ